MFHYRDGLSFGRLHDGSVVIVKTDRSTITDGEEFEIFRIVIDPNNWASIVASVSKGGEEHGRFYQAQRFHASEGEVSLLVNT